MNITTRYTTTDKGAGRIVAKGHGKQRTVSYDHRRSWDANHGAAAGTLLNVLLSAEQRAKVLHPSGAQRVKHTAHDNSHHSFVIEV